MAGLFSHAWRPFQSGEALAESDLLAWETSAGDRLPGDYRSFMLRFNGGSLRPFAFELGIPDWNFTDKVHALNHLFDWAEVGKRSQWTLEPALRNIPPDRLAIGATTSELTLALSTDPSRFGAIDAWVRDTFNVWGEGGNTRVVPVAPSFTAFLAMLRDSADAYHSFWADFDRGGETARRRVLP